MFPYWYAIGFNATRTDYWMRRVLGEYALHGRYTYVSDPIQLRHADWGILWLCPGYKDLPYWPVIDTMTRQRSIFRVEIEEWPS